jgi:hypothetical protein
MTRTDILTRLRPLEPQLRASGVSALYLFGSHARDEAGPHSDVDLFVDPTDDETFDLNAFSRTYDLLEQALPGTLIGYSARDSIIPCYRPQVERDAIRVF